MNLNHINLCASDVAAMTSVLERHLDFRVLEQGKVPNYPGAQNAGSDFSMLLGADGSYLVISEIEAPEPTATAYPVGFHVGLMQDSADAVRAKHGELRAAGLTPGEISTFEVFGSTWTTFYCPIGDGLEIEINFRTSSPVLDGPFA